MITLRQRKEIYQLNSIFKNNEYFINALSTDTGVGVSRDVYTCINIVDLYSYLYKHYELLHDIFKSNSEGNIDMYLAHRIITTLHNYMCVNQYTAAQAIKELKRIRSCVDYDGSLG